jgi:hypothetical protein
LESRLEPGLGGGFTVMLHDGRSFDVLGVDAVALSFAVEDG